MAAYSSVADFEAYVEGWVTENSAALNRLLERASRDIDYLVGDWTVESDGWKFGNLTTNPKGLTTDQIAALKRAVCAQAEYRFYQGEGFFSQPQFKRVKGPDFEVEAVDGGEPSNVGSKVWRELEGTGLLRLTGQVGSARDRPPWWSFSYEDSAWDYDPPPLFRR